MYFKYIRIDTCPRLKFLYHNKAEFVTLASSCVPCYPYNYYGVNTHLHKASIYGCKWLQSRKGGFKDGNICL